MAREHRWLQAVHPVFPLAPKPYVYCDQPEVLGAPFFVMERRSGIVVDRSWPDAYPETPEAARALAEALIDTLVALHAVDYSATAVVDMVRPEGYLERQVTGLVQRYQRAQTHDNPLALKVGQWMVNHLPKSPTPTLIHNDLKLNNMLFAPTDPGRPVAVLDWEMSTVGDPLSDFAILLSYWCEPDDPPLFRQLISPLTTRPGFPNRDALIQTYACKSGRDVSQMRYYMVFGYFKAAVICQQIFYRYAKGQTDDERFSQLGAAADGLVERAFALL
ncbi:hypothetical protein GCM10025857_11130 [Alicyclobacillus contaminans]|nr:hypothetical protein GCM10025857_11130 [Alicyclobacillus contaminans]